MIVTEVHVPDLPSPARLAAPGGAPRAVVVALHGAGLPRREQPLFEHLATTLAPVGVAVLSYDRRPSDGGDVPLADQAADAVTAARWLIDQLGVPVGLYGFSQGAWAAVLAAGAIDPAFLVLVGWSGVTPAAQMRFHTDELLRRAGHDEPTRARLDTLRRAMEELLRGRGDRERTAALLADAVDEPWFALAYLPPELPPAQARWDDLDLDPGPATAAVSCPTLLVHGAEEDTVPVAESVRVWRTHAGVTPTVVRLPGCGHLPATAPAPLDTPASELSPAYGAAVADFVRQALTQAGGRSAGPTGPPPV